MIRSTRHASARDPAHPSAANDRFDAVDSGVVMWSPHPWIRHLADRLHARHPRYGPAYYDPAFGLWGRVRSFRPDVVHVHGLTLDPALAASHWLRGRGAAIVASFHGGAPAPGGATGAIRRANLRRLDRAMFSAPELAEPWVTAGNLAPEQVAVVLETSTAISPVDPAAARSRLRLAGDPLVVMACRLDPVKDPVTALTGFALFAERRAGARLAVFGKPGSVAPYLASLVAAIPGLDDLVDLRPAVPPESMNQVLSAADYLIQASRREWSGLVVLEALACGAVPVLSDIPSFRAITGSGVAGRLFPTADPEGLARGLEALESEGRQPAALAARRRFDMALSFPALAARLEEVYGEAIRVRRRRD
jgi:glycosyltransferase involved in cell wall biosynthesis